MKRGSPEPQVWALSTRLGEGAEGVLAQHSGLQPVPLSALPGLLYIQVCHWLPRSDGAPIPPLGICPVLNPPTPVWMGPFCLPSPILPRDWCLAPESWPTGGMPSLCHDSRCCLAVFLPTSLSSSSSCFLPAPGLVYLLGNLYSSPRGQIAPFLHLPPRCLPPRDDSWLAVANPFGPCALLAELDSEAGSACPQVPFTLSPPQ